MIDEEKKVSKEIKQAQKAVEQAKARLQRAKNIEADKKIRSGRKIHITKFSGVVS